MSATCQCPFHRLTFTPLPHPRGSCEQCRCPGSTAVLECPACGYGVCKWCCVGGDRLVALVARAEAAMAELREEVMRVKAGVDGDVFMWV